MRVPVAICGGLLFTSMVSVVWAQDAVKVDPKHYSVISENDQVRILKVHYGPHEKSIMHSHPNLAVVFLTDSKGTFTYPDGKKEDWASKPGQAMFAPAGTHLPENTSDAPMDLILVELKGHAAKAEMKAEMK